MDRVPSVSAVTLLKPRFGSSVSYYLHPPLARERLRQGLCSTPCPLCLEQSLAHERGTRHCFCYKRINALSIWREHEEPTGRTQKRQATGRGELGKCVKGSKRNFKRWSIPITNPAETPGGRGEAPGLRRRFTARRGQREGGGLSEPSSIR